MTEELYRKYRPQTFKEVVGQDEAVSMLIDMGRRRAVPHCVLFTGQSGCGKTTLARILRVKMKCGDSDYCELNTADFRGIDMVREIRQRVGLASIAGKGRPRVWLIDECHQLSKDAQHAFLKMLEDPPDHVYFFLATTNPEKLLATIRTRATEVKCRALKAKEMEMLIKGVWLEENGFAVDEEGETVDCELDEDILDKIVELADGSPRKGLVLLNQVVNESDPEKALAVLSGGVADQEAIDLARALIQPRCTWTSVAKVLKSIEGLEQEAESIRRVVLGYMASAALNGSARAVAVIDCFRDNYFDCGRAGLIASCYEACHLDG